MDLHLELEERLARFKRRPASLVYQTGFAANSGLIPQLAGKGDLIISDELNHGSIIDGVRLTSAERAIYKHCDTDDLASKLEEAELRDPPYCNRRGVLHGRGCRQTRRHLCTGKGV